MNTALNIHFISLDSVFKVGEYVCSCLKLTELLHNTVKILIKQMVLLFPQGY